MDNNSPFSRRLFLQQGVTLASLVATVPWFVERSALGMLPQDRRVSSQPGVPEGHILVVVQLGGGNDGLSTVVPYGADEYYRARPQIAIAQPDKEGGVLELDKGSGLGLHPNLRGFKDLYGAGELAIIQGVGYPNPNRSHFTSMDIWHTASRSGRGTGWIGRYTDCACNGSPAADALVAIGRNAPVAMVGDSAKPVAFENERLFQWMGKDLPGSMDTPYDTINRAGPLAGVDPSSQAAFLMRTALDAQLSSDRIRAAIARTPLVPYPTTQFGNQLRSIGAMIRAGLGTRVYYASRGGFDTHSNQQGAHGNLMREVSEAVSAFQNDLKSQGNDGRVVTMVFSEFGRRVRQNGSGGTDHGTAAPMFVIGAPIKGGLHGEHPSMTDLDNGDLKFTTDFRSVYATILDKWMGTKSNAVLGGAFPTLKFMRA